MPRKLRVSKARVDVLDDMQWLELTCGQGGAPAFEDEEAARRAWRWHRGPLLAESPPGSRPAGWWRFEAPAARDEDTAEVLQLYRLGVLEGDELEAVKATWRREETTARRSAKVHLDIGEWLQAWSEYADRREWAGIPAEFQEGGGGMAIPPVVTEG